MRDDLDRLVRIREHGEQLLQILDRRKTTRDDILNDAETQYIITTPLIIIGEEANKLSPEIISSYDDVAWLNAAGIRHRLAHNYMGTDWNVVSDVVFNEIPIMLEQVRSIIEEQAAPKSPADEIKELKAARPGQSLPSRGTKSRDGRSAR